MKYAVTSCMAMTTASSIMEALPNVRRLVKRLLKNYKYPPEEAEDAMNIVLKQCEQWADNQD